MAAPDSPPRGTKRKASDIEPPRRIRALHQDVVNKIAAGEIIVAPVHALKELIENAVDAGSTSLEILVKEGGLKLLQITDNGSGIHKDDLPILCERFTTSKLKAFEDLQSMSTYGFRGEALASISHIAHLSVTTKTQESSCAWKAHYAGGKLVAPKPGQSADPKPCAGRQGTQIVVEDLFFNVPSRRRAFRSASEEYAKIADVVGRYAVHCKDVAFSCKKYGEAGAGIAVPANATLRDRIRLTHSGAVANELVEVKVANDHFGFRAEGYVSTANYHSKRTSLLLFINHRSVESTIVKRSIEQTYNAFLPKGGKPFVYLSIEIEPARVDVNVHPTKREVNFLNEEEIVEMICEEIRVQLGSVDTSRTFMTQSVLSGGKTPSIARAATVPEDGPALAATPTPAFRRTLTNNSVSSTTKKPYENNLVRTDARTRKITSFLPSAAASHDASASTDPSTLDSLRISYTTIPREPTLCRLTTIKELRASVRESMHNELTDTFLNHTFIGIVDSTKRIAAIQSGVKLFLIDYGLICAEYFYQLGLTDFGNFGTIHFDPPLDLDGVLSVGVEQMRVKEPDSETIKWSEVQTKVKNQLVGRREMLEEYFSLSISEDGQLQGIPLLVKGYMPSMGKLPSFLLRLGPQVDWTEEKGCFRTFLRELASFYAPEGLLPPSASVAATSTTAGHERDETTQQPRADREIDTEDRMDETPDGDGTEAAENARRDKQSQTHAATTSGNSARNGDASAAVQEKENAALEERRRHVHHALENILFPAFKARLIATKPLLKGVVEVANLRGLYRVFERC